MIDFKKAVLLTLTVIFFLIVLFFYRSHLLSVRFVDEEEYFAAGRFMQKGEKLYDDLITNHQPLAYVFSSTIQKIANPPNMYKMIIDHRLAVFGWNFLWSLALVFNFGPAALIFSAIFELSKSYLFGNLFLPESLIVYPLVFLSGLVIREGKLRRKSLLGAGLIAGLCIFLLEAVWPVIFLMGALLIKKSFPKKHASFLLLGLSAVVCFVFLFCFAKGYVNYTLMDNLVYTVPNYHQAYYSEPWSLTLVKSFLTPVLSFGSQNATTTLYIIRVFTILFLLNLIFLVLRGRKAQVLITLTLLGLANIHFVSPGTEHYSAGFLPWYGLFLFLTTSISLKNFLLSRITAFRLAVILLGLAGFFFSSRGSLLFLQKQNPMQDFTLNYSTFEDRGRAVNIMANRNDRLFVSPDDWLIYWQANINHLPKLYGYYAWMSGIPEIHERILSAFKKDPPEFFYCDNCKGLDLEKYLTEYLPLKQNRGETNLYVLQKKFKTLTNEQKSKLKYYGYE